MKFFNKTLLAILLSVFFSSCGVLGVHFKVYNPKKEGTYPKETKQNKLLAETTKFRTCFDVYHNDINIEVVPSKKFISGKVKISAKAITDFDTLQIDLYKNMKLKSVDFENQALIYKREEGAIFDGTTSM